MRNLACGAEVGPKKCPNVGNMALHEPPPKPKNVGNSGKNASFERVAFSRQNWLEQLCQGAELQIDPDGLKHMEVQVTSKLLQLATLWPQLHTKLGPTGNEASSIAKNVEKQFFVFGWQCPQC